MSSEKPWYIYHFDGNGGVVMDVADHCDHIEQVHKAMGLPNPNYMAGLQTPMSAETMAKYEAQYKVKFNPAPRPPLPKFVEPTGWTKIKERRAAKEKEKEKVK